MDREEKVKLLDVFNHVDFPWSDEFREEFYARYRALAYGFTTGIQKELTRLRSGCFSVTNELPTTGLFLTEVGTLVDEESKETTFALQAGYSIILGKVTPEAIDEAVNDVANEIFIREHALVREAISLLEDQTDEKPPAILYVKEPFTAHDDLSLPKQKKIGIFGWEKISVNVKERI